MGSVIFQNIYGLDAPSTRALSYKEFGICFSADKKISIEEPNCQTANKIKVHIAVLVLPSHAN